MSERRRRIAALVVGVAAAVLAGCGSDGAPTIGSGHILTGELRVSAAASLTDALAAIETGFTSTHPEVDVLINLGGSSTLREQILQGAPVDVFISADPSHTGTIQERGAAAGEPVPVARNRLQIAVPAGNPAGIDGLEDLADEDLLVGVCAEQVPCGRLAREVFRKAGVDPAIDTEEPDVRALLTKVETGELDAGITYATDVSSRPDAVAGIEIPDGVGVAAEYSLVVLADAPNPAAAEAFASFLLSGTGQSILADHGFEPR